MPPKRDFEMAKKIIDLKTTTLFEAAFFFGWIFGGGNLEKVESVRELSHHFGLAFQVGDDIKDYDQDRHRKGSLNAAVLLGVERAHSLFQGEVALFYEKLERLNLASENMLTIASLLEKQVLLLSS
jgi:geranylgeranyl diphosphate synthase type II